MANMTSGISSKIQDIMLKSKLVQNGPPARYQLSPHKKCLDGKPEAESKLRRWTIEERNYTKNNKTILMVGETGSGKSTLINTLINYVMGVEWENNVWFDIVEDEKRNQSESQTSAVTVYEIFGFEGCRVPYCLTIIDTPGYGDTRGLRNDTLIKEKLYELFRSEDGIREMYAVAFVMKESINRLSDRQKYIVAAVVSLFGKDMVNNIVSLLTYSSGVEPTDALQALKDANVPLAKNDSNKAVYFQFNNCRHVTFTNDQKATNKEQRILKNNWDLSADGLEEFSEFLGKVKPQSVKMTEGVLRQQKQLGACVNNIVERAISMDLMEKELEKIQAALRAHKDVLSTFKIKSVIQEKVKEQIKTSWWHMTEKATTCDVCKENCHYPGCWWVKDLSWCSSMTDNHCTVCSQKCHYSKHVQRNYIWKTEAKTIDLTGDHLTEENGVFEKEKLIEEQEKKLKVNKQEKAKLLMKAYQSVLELEKNGLKLSLCTAQHLDFLVENMKETGNTEHVKKLEELKRKAQEDGVALKYSQTN